MVAREAGEPVRAALSKGAVDQGRATAGRLIQLRSSESCCRIDQPRSREEEADGRKAPSGGWRSKVRGRGERQ